MAGRSLIATAGRSVAATWHDTEPPLDGPEATSWHRLDLARPDTITETVARLRPTLIINAAYVRAGPDMEAVTAVAPGHLAAAAAAVGAALVHLSTDVVFAGNRDAPYRESDRPDPVHEYGRIKARSEQAVTTHHRRPLIVRTSLLYGRVDGVQERLVTSAAAEGVRFFTDEVRCPAHVDDLATAVWHMVDRQLTGIVHAVGADAVDRLALARLLAPGLGIDGSALTGGPSEPYPIRPHRLELTTTRSDVTDLVPLPGCRARLGGSDGS